MKNNKIKLVYTLLITILLITVACEANDPYELVNDSKPLVVQGTDFNLSIVENSLMADDVIGTVIGTSNKGSVNFEILSQIPTDAMAIDPSTGALTVVNPGAFIVNTQITGVAQVEKDGVTDDLNITITVVPEVIPPCSDPIFNINTWLGNLDVEDVGYSTNSGVGLEAVACDQLIITGDILGFGCDPSAQISLTFIPESDGATNGTVLAAAPQPYDCDGATDYSFVFPSGTYDENTGVILVDYEFYQDGNLSFPGQFRITSACTSTVNVDIWSGGINVEDVGYSTASSIGTPGCGELTIAGDLLTFGCSNTPTISITLVPSAEGSTSGTVVAIQQQYDCEPGQDNTMTFPGGGVYDETTEEILINYEYFQDGLIVFPGQFRITPQ